MVPAVGLEPMWKVSKACVYAALRRPTPSLIGTNWYDVVRFVPYQSAWLQGHEMYRTRSSSLFELNSTVLPRSALGVLFRMCREGSLRSTTRTVNRDAHSRHQKQLLGRGPSQAPNSDSYVLILAHLASEIRSNAVV
jgi:hypothetical protein